MIQIKIFVFCLFVWVTNSQTSGFRIHDNLQHCYRSNQTVPWVGNSVQLLLELIRKIEDANPTSMDIRRLSVNIIHQMRLDGIERTMGVTETEFVIPYGVLGRMLPKFQVLLQLISNTPGAIQFENFLSPEEMCYLHQMISSTVEPYHRGDETRTCPVILMSNHNRPSHTWNLNKVRHPTWTNVQTVVSNQISRCPIERGISRSIDYGTISLGTFIASVAAGLQPQTVRISDFVSFQSGSSPFENLETMEVRDTSKMLNKLLKSLDSVDNTYSAGLAGDLAEVCVFQGPILGGNLSVGMQGTWNDTLFPRVSYLPQNHQELWEMTDAEILAGLDGLFISQQVTEWVGRIGRIRLSQLIDMYYSARGIPSKTIEDVNRRQFHRGRPKVFRSFEELKSENFVDDRQTTDFGVNRACDRMRILNLIDVKKLKDETYFFSQILQFTTPSIGVTDVVMRRNCDTAVDRFLEYTKSLLNTLPSCNELVEEKIKPAVDLTLIIDGSRRQYENLQLINHIAEMIDVSSYNSHISVIHGQSGQYMVNRTNSVASAFIQLRNFSDPYPTTLSLSRSLASVVHELANQTDREQRERVIASTSKVVLIISQGPPINQADFDSARRMIEGSLLQFPDLYFVFITNNPKTFTELVSGAISRSLLFSGPNQTPQSDTYTVIEATSLDPSTFTREMVKTLKRIPKRIVAPFCKNGRVVGSNDGFIRDQFEQYLTPDIEVRFRVSPYYLRYTDFVQFQFVGVDYGDFTVCMSRKSNLLGTCTTVTESNVGMFNITQPCETPMNCAGIFFSVTMDNSKLMCSENDCRYPDQVRFILRHEGLRCEIDARNNSSRLSNTIFKIYLTIIFSFLVYIFRKDVNIS